MIVSESILRNKSKEFAKQIVYMCRDIKAKYAQGKKDFISKLEIAQKECFETEYWLELLFETGYISETVYKPLQNQCGTIRRMLISSINTVKKNDK